jgi:hypothetical protein
VATGSRRATEPPAHPDATAGLALVLVVTLIVVLVVAMVATVALMVATVALMVELIALVCR